MNKPIELLAVGGAYVDINCTHFPFGGQGLLPETGFIKELVAQADYYFPSRDEFQQLWSVSSIEEGLEKLSGETVAVTVVKDGTNGAVTMIDGKVVRIPSRSN